MGESGKPYKTKNGDKRTWLQERGQECFLILQEPPGSGKYEYYFDDTDELRRYVNDYHALGKRRRAEAADRKTCEKYEFYSHDV